ncbi:MAG: hypothetical protein AAB573_01425 [Patescibacteria group bacterium]
METGDKKLQPSPFAGAPQIPQEHAERVCRINGGKNATCTYLTEATLTKNGKVFRFCAKKVPAFKALIDQEREARGLTYTERNFCTAGYPDGKPIAH